jgi:exodeoxyribonuclease V beta subunit
VKPAPDFHLHSTPLQPGITLLEASAGTGKTYTISGIVARLVAIDDLQLREILVVTFTEAATTELRGRIRQRLLQVAQDLERHASPDQVSARKDFIDPVARAILDHGVPTDLARRRLALALASFDEATISTIHGFCQRLLRDNAFEGDAPFESEVIADSKAMLLDLAHDFWHQRLREAPPLAAALADRSDLAPTELASLLVKVSRQPGLCVLPTATETLDAAMSRLLDAWNDTMKVWRLRGTALSESMANHPSLKRAKDSGFPPDRLRDIRSSLDDVASGGIATVDAIEALLSLTADAVEGARKQTAAAKRDPYPHDDFFDRCSAFDEARVAWIAALRADWLDFAAKGLPRLKAERKLLTFDDMLARTQAALAGAQGPALVAAVRRQFRAALIDEFQDTDPIQYDIFRRFFADPPQRLMLIGDPKQAIYAFRGADLFTYLGARREVLDTSPPRIHTLRTNYRSSTGLVEAVNEIFGESPGCFMQPGIDFVRALPDGKRAAERPLHAPQDEAATPMVLVLTDADAEDSAQSGTDPRTAIIGDLVTEISYLLDGWQLGTGPLSAADIAVLVRTHREASAVEDALRAAGIPAIRRTNESVFHSLEAEELLRIVAAVLEPSREAAVRTALTATCFGLTAVDLLQLENGESSWADWVNGFSSLRERWMKRGFATMFRELLVRRQLRRKLVAQRDGERKLTNLLHLAELAQQAEHELRLSPEGVIEWLRERRRDPREAVDEHVQRLEKDDEAVKVVTVHNAKGLEYPVVFCLSHWADKKPRDILFHQPDSNRLTLDLAEKRNPDHVQRAAQELLAEEVRLLYVSLTRAVQRCYLYVHTHGDSARSAIGAVLGADPAATGKRLADAHPQIIRWRTLHAADAAKQPASCAPGPVPSGLQPREIFRSPEATALVGSFSRLIAGAAEENAQDHDELGPGELGTRSVGTGDDADTLAPAEGTAAARVPAIFRLPRGAATGVALHAVLEHADFRRPDTLGPLIATHFAPLRLDDEYMSALQQQLSMLLAHPLQAGERIVRLAEVGVVDRLNEVEFYYPVKAFSVAALAEACAMPRQRSGVPQRIGRLQFSPIDGYLRGFMDVVFRHEGRYYLADWKSNWLGNRSVDYTPERLERAMAENFYHLQSWLYALALDRFLASRLHGYSYEQHFGGIFYVFVRGLDPAAPQRGVHYARPSAAFLRRLGTAILQDAGEPA